MEDIPGGATSLEATGREGARSLLRDLDAMAGAPAPPEAGGGAPAEPRRLGDFEILRRLGGGGMGEVFLASQAPLGRPVALKLLSEGRNAKPETILRFLREAKAAGSIDHPSIVSVHDAGMLDGVPYIAMRYVEGETLAARIAAASAEDAAADARRTPGIRLPPREGAGDEDAAPAADPARIVHFFEEAALALHAAHEAGFIHRDVKPSNIMAGSRGEPVILDFGLARLEEGRSDTLTQPGDLLGTPAYMSPEQLLAERVHLDRRTDVYSLGATLYECLTLRRPFDAPTREALYQAILTKTPPDPRAWNPRISRDIKVVLFTALEKDRERRYQTALDFAADLRRAREGRTVRARPTGAVLKAGRWARRNPLAGISLAGIFVVLAAALAVAIAFLGRLRQERDAKAAALAVAERNRLLALSWAVLPASPEQALLLAMAGSARPLSPPAKTALWSALESVKERRTLIGHAKSVVDAAFSPDGRQVVTASADGTARIWEAEKGRVLHVLRGNGSMVYSAVFSPDGSRVLTAHADKVARIWDLVTRKPVLILEGHESDVRGAAYGPDPAGSDPGPRIITAGNDGTARIWDGAGKEVRVLAGHGGKVYGALFDTSGRRAVTASADGAVRVWEAETGRPTLEVKEGAEVRYAAFDPSGRLIVTAPATRHVAIVRDAGTGGEVLRLEGHGGALRMAEFSRDGARILTASWDGTARLWDLKGTEVLRFSAQGGYVRSARFHPRENVVVTALADRTARIWDGSGEKESLLEEEARLGTAAGEALSLAFSPGGDRLATGAADGARIWNLNAPGAPRLIHGRARVNSALFSPDGARVVTAGADGTARVWKAGDGSEVSRLVHEVEVTYAAFSADGARIATACADGKAFVWNAASGKRSLDLRGHSRRTLSTAFSSGGEAIVTAGQDKMARVWDAASGEETARLSGHEGSVTWAEFSRDGTRLLTASEDDTVRVWDAADGVEIVSLSGSVGRARSARFGPEGDLILIASHGGAIKVWDFASGRNPVTLKEGLEGLRLAVASRDGQRLATAAGAEVRVWRVRDPLEVAESRKPRDLMPGERHRFQIGSAAR